MPPGQSPSSSTDKNPKMKGKKTDNPSKNDVKNLENELSEPDPNHAGMYNEPDRTSTRLTLENPYSPLATEEIELSSSSSEEEDSHDRVPLTKKRSALEAGFSPKDESKRRRDKTRGTNLTQVVQVEMETVSQVSRPSNIPSTSSNHIRQELEQSNVVKPRKDKTKYSFIVKSVNDNDIQLKKLVQAIEKAIPKGSVIRRHDMSRNRKIAMFKTENENPNRPSFDVNELLRPEVTDTIISYYGDSVEIKHYDPTEEYNQVDDATHVIIKYVSLEYTEEDLLEFAEEEGGGIREKIKFCKRITSAATGKPTPLVRVVCRDENTAKTLVKDGLRIGSVIFRCEPPLPRFLPVRCFKCQKFNHTSRQCQNEQKCGKCGENDHRTKDCKKERELYKCANCGQRHAARSAACQDNIDAMIEATRKEAEKNRPRKPTEASTSVLGRREWSTPQPTKTWANVTEESSRAPAKSGPAKDDQQPEIELVPTRHEFQELMNSQEEMKGHMKDIFTNLNDQIKNLTDTIHQIPVIIGKYLDQHKTTSNEQLGQETTKIKQLVEGNMRNLEDFTTSYGKQLDTLVNTINKTEKVTENLNRQQEINNELFRSLPEKIQDACQELVVNVAKTQRSRTVSIDRRRQTNIHQAMNSARAQSSQETITEQNES